MYSTPRLHFTLAATILFLFALSARAEQGTIVIPTKLAKLPASNLVAPDGTQLDSSTAIGYPGDLSKLNPSNTDLWSDASLSAVDMAGIPYPADSSTVDGASAVDAVTDAAAGGVLYDTPVYQVFRASVKDAAGNTFHLTASVHAHAALLRSALMRKMGYDLASPQYYRNLKVRFPTAADQAAFLQRLADDNDVPLDDVQSPGERWVARIGDREVVLQDIVLQPARVTRTNLQWGIVQPKYDLGNKREMRALLIPFILGGVAESVNLYGGEIARIASDNLILVNPYFGLYFPYTEVFRPTSYDDIRWAMRKIGALTRAELEEVARQGAWPANGTQEIVTEKLVDLRNQLVRITGLGKEYADLPAAPQKSVAPAVKDGKVVVARVPGFASRFAGGDPKSPIRTSDILRYFQANGQYGPTLDTLTSWINALMPGKSSDDIIQAHQDEIDDQISEHFRKNNCEKDPDACPPFQYKTKVWGGLPWGVAVVANRAIVRGNRYGDRDDVVQMVDSVTIQVHAGYFLGLDGLPKIAPEASGQIALRRDYVHVRPLINIKSAVGAKEGLKTPLALLIPKKMDGIADLMKASRLALDPAAADAAEAKATQLEANALAATNEADGFVRNADAARAANAKDAKNLEDKARKALARAKKLEDEAKQARSYATELRNGPKSASEAFLKAFRPGENFIINDSFQVANSIGIPVPILPLVGISVSGTGPQLSFSVGHSYQQIKRTMIMREENAANGTPTALTVYASRIKDKGLDFSFDLNYFINIFHYSKEYGDAAGETAVYRIPLDAPANSDAQKDALGAARSVFAQLPFKKLFLAHDTRELDRKYPPYKLSHDLESRLSRKLFLFKKVERLEETHVVRICPPEKGAPSGAYVPCRKANDPEMQTIASARLIRRSGNNFFGLISDAIKKFFGLSLGGDRRGENPGFSMFGEGKWSAIRAEADLTDGPNYSFSPYVYLDNYWVGWSIKREDFLKIFDEIEAGLGAAKLPVLMVNRGEFADTKKILSYQIRTSLAINKEGMQNLITDLHLLDPAVSDDALRASLFALWKAEDADKLAAGSKTPDWIKDIIKARNKAPDCSSHEIEKRIDCLEWFTRVADRLGQAIETGRLIAGIGKNAKQEANYFFQLVVTGFRKGDEKGDPRRLAGAAYFSNTLGTFDRAMVNGPFVEASRTYKISDYEMRFRFSTGGSF